MSAGSLVFVAGGTGYIGRPFISELLRRGHAVRALVRPGSENRLPAGAAPVLGDALRSETFADQVAPADTFVQLVGVSHPSPAKAAEFRSVDLASVRASAQAAAGAGIGHFVYLSVAQPAPAIMKTYAAIRVEGEAVVRATGMNATFLRPWYVLGPGHRWPYLLAPTYWMWNNVRVLLLDQSLLLALASLPVFWFARERLGRAAALAFQLAFLASWGVLDAVGFDFHEYALAAPLVALGLYAAVQRRTKLLCSVLPV